MKLFKKKQYVVLNFNEPNTIKESTPSIPDGLWIKCNYCKKTIYKNYINRFNICPECKGYFRLGAWERLSLICDEDSFIEMDKNISAKNPIDFPHYEKKIKQVQEKTNMKDAVITGTGKIHNEKSVICCMDSNFIMGSMGSVVGEKITRAFEYAIEKKLPVIIFATSGGARMQEGIISLMQMAKISAAVKKHSDAGLLFISVLTDPTTGGVTASFAMLGDIILAEPKALIGFAGRRVIEQTIKQSLPENFQTSEFLLENGFIDKIVRREEMNMTLGKLLSIHAKK